MARTTLNIDTPILNAIKRLQKAEHKGLGTLVSELLSEALEHRKNRGQKNRKLGWYSQPMDARVDLADRDAVYDAMEELDR